MPKTRIAIYDNKIYDSCGPCLECKAPTIYKGKRVCSMDELLKGDGIKQPICECLECQTRYIINEDDNEQK